jgi:hypothetical protein
MMPYSQNEFPSTMLFGTGDQPPGGGSAGGGKRKPKKAAKKAKPKK